MTNEDALLRAVIADPDDDAPRLIYADWLDEQGQSERAEFIRLQCDRARRWSHGDYPSELIDREEELLKAYGPAWARAVNTITREWTFERGFINSVLCSASVLLTRADDLFRAAPVRHLSVQDARRVAREFFRLPQLSNLRSLSLYFHGLGDRAVGHLARCSYLKGLLELDLTDTGIGLAGARALAVSPYLHNLESLCLYNNSRMGDEGRHLLVRRFGDRVHF